MSNARRDSNDSLDTRFSDLETVAIAVAKITANTATVTAPNAFVFDTVVMDNTGSYSNSTGKFTCPSAGKYRVSVSSIYSNGTSYFAIYKNGAKYLMIAASTNGNSTPVLGGGSIIVDCVQGDLLHFGPATGSFQLAFIVNNYESNITFERVSN